MHHGVSLRIMVKAQRWVYSREFVGEPKQEDFNLEEVDLPALQNGEFLVEALYISVDPYMRAYAASLKTGQTMIGGQVGKVIESKNPTCPVGTFVLGYLGWRTHTVVSNIGTADALNMTSVKKLRDMGNLPVSLGIGALGMPGMTAHSGFLECCQPKEGETVLVNAASGAVGSLVGQIAKLKGCKVIGYAGSDEKVKWIKEELGFDFAFNYKTTKLKETLVEAAPNGIDCYFDNVGGEFSNIVLQHMNKYGRVAICGNISLYNDDPAKPQTGPYNYGLILFKELTVRGFLIWSFADKEPEAFKNMLQWIQEGKIKYKEHVTQGFENMPSAFIGLMKGENIGKAVVKI